MPLKTHLSNQVLFYKDTHIPVAYNYKRSVFKLNANLIRNAVKQESKLVCNKHKDGCMFCEINYKSFYISSTI